MDINEIKCRNGEIIQYTIRRSSRAKRVSMTLFPEGRFVVTIPIYRTEQTAKRFVYEKRDWIQKHYNKIKGSDKVFLPDHTKSEQREHVKNAKVLLVERVEFWNKYYNFSYKKIFIKNHKAQWGSCSSDKNLNFNYKLIFLPPELSDYIVVHELCHLKEMNHKKPFWSLVAKVFPDYKEKVKQLDRYVIGK